MFLFFPSILRTILILPLFFLQLLPEHLLQDLQLLHPEVVVLLVVAVVLGQGLVGLVLVAHAAQHADGVELHGVGVGGGGVLQALGSTIFTHETFPLH